MLNITAKFKKLFFVNAVCIITLSMGSFALQSTDFNRINTGNKIIISMNPIYSEGDPLPPLASDIASETTQKPTPDKKYIAYNNPSIYQPKLIKPRQKTHDEKPTITAQPLSIIPNYVPQKKDFFNNRVVAVNSYLKKIPNAYTHGSQVFSGKIPTHGSKYLRPISVSHVNNNNPSHTLPIYNQYVSIER